MVAAAPGSPPRAVRICREDRGEAAHSLQGWFGGQIPGCN